MDKNQAIQLLTNLERDYRSYADAFKSALEALQGVIAIVDKEKDLEIASLQEKLPPEVAVEVSAEVPANP